MGFSFWNDRICQTEMMCIGGVPVWKRHFAGRPLKYFTWFVGAGGTVTSVVCFKWKWNGRAEEMGARGGCSTRPFVRQAGRWMGLERKRWKWEGGRMRASKSMYFHPRRNRWDACKLTHMCARAYRAADVCIWSTKRHICACQQEECEREGVHLHCVITLHAVVHAWTTACSRTSNSQMCTYI